LDLQLHHFWKDKNYWNGGNIFYWRAKAPKRMSPQVLSQALAFEFDLPYANGTRMGLVKRAKEAFSNRLGQRIP
jgi:hypothetical protein